MINTASSAMSAFPNTDVTRFAAIAMLALPATARQRAIRRGHNAGLPSADAGAAAHPGPPARGLAGAAEDRHGLALSRRSESDPLKVGILGLGDACVVGGSRACAGQFCLGDACGAGRFCQGPARACGGDGRCAPIEAFVKCTMDFRQVCGCDGRTYDNTCRAGGQGVSVAYEGPCKKSAPAKPTVVSLSLVSEAAPEIEGHADAAGQLTTRGEALEALGERVDVAEPAMQALRGSSLTSTSTTDDPTSFPTSYAPTSFPTSREPTPAPSSPSYGPTTFPTSYAPTSFPTNHTSYDPTTFPTSYEPTSFPTSRDPVPSPSHDPTSFPTSHKPTSFPTTNLTPPPTTSPTKGPTKSPTKSPTASPTKGPTKSPTESPTTSPTKGPTKDPTKSPTERPTSQPTITIFHVDWFSERCVKNEGNSARWDDAYDTISLCCDQLPWIDRELCTREQATVTNFYPDWTGNSGTCLNDGNEPLHMKKAQGVLFGSLEACCDHHYSGWNKEQCMSAGLGR